MHSTYANHPKATSAAAAPRQTMSCGVLHSNTIRVLSPYSLQLLRPINRSYTPSVSNEWLPHSSPFASQPVMSIDRNNKLAIVAYYMAYGYELTNFRESPNRSGKSNDFDKSQCASKSFKKCNTFLVVSFLRLLCYLVLLYVPLMAVYIYICAKTFAGRSGFE